MHVIYVGTASELDKETLEKDLADILKWEISDVNPLTKTETTECGSQAE